MPDAGLVLGVERIIDLKATKKPEALREMVDLLRGSGDVPDLEAFHKAIAERERIFSSGIGLGLAVPHAKAPGAKGFVMCLGRSTRGIPFDALDDLPVQLIVLIAMPDLPREQWLKLLSKIALFLKRKETREQILRASGPGQVYELMKAL
ncbi:MAG: PTS sugar transporter subunit IIA [Planctomycetes bacterium]|nr:PTS sugar transporter subunit IIA [Planctomycetota bacterium]